jgi:hypothetical protein
MRIDATHYRWAVATAVLFVLATAGYIVYAGVYPGGPRGNTVPGLIYGVAGYGMMLYAGLMGARKKVPTWRIGRGQTWMRGHLWMGFLSLPFLAYHSAFTANGPLTFFLMVLLVIVALSGITGATLQHFIPVRLTAAVPLETIYEQIPEVREQLRMEATAIVNALCAVSDEVAVMSGAPGGHFPAAQPLGENSSELTGDQQRNLRAVFDGGILPFLRNPDAGSSLLASPVKAKSYFDALRRQMPEPVHEAIGDLESICEEERQLFHQRRMYVLLHAWTLVHVPISILLLVLGGIHAVIATRY